MRPLDGKLLTVTPGDNIDALKGLASPVRMDILCLLRERGPLNVQQISEALGLPQSTVATNVLILEETRLIRATTVKGRRGHQKICEARFEEIVVRFNSGIQESQDDPIEVSMPLGLYTSCEVSSPCGLCSTEAIIGALDVPDSFLDPRRMLAALIWFGQGHVEYKFPNNARLLSAELERLEVSLELASEAPGSAEDWPSDISVWINDVHLGAWTAPGDHGGVRGRFTPHWWKLESSQFGELKSWTVDRAGTTLDGQPLSGVTLDDLDLPAHRSIRVRIGIHEGARYPGGVNIFGRGFGNHDQDIVMRLHRRR
jgi:predicted transcriptional regulator